MILKGVIKPVRGTYSFELPVFLDDTGRYHLQHAERGIICYFEPVKLTGIPLLRTKEMEVKEGDLEIFGFVLKSKVLSGTRLTLSMELASIVKDPDININTRITISSFLKLNNLTKELIEESNERFQKAGLPVCLDLDNFLPSLTEMRNEPIAIKTTIEYMEMLMEINKKVSWNDALILERNYALVDKYKCTINSFLGYFEYVRGKNPVYERIIKHYQENPKLLSDQYLKTNDKVFFLLYKTNLNLTGFDEPIAFYTETEENMQQKVEEVKKNEDKIEPVVPTILANLVSLAKKAKKQVQYEESY